MATEDAAGERVIYLQSLDNGEAGYDRYTLFADGTYRREVFSTPDATQQGCTGYADEPLVGLRCRDRRRIFVALYTDPAAGTVILRVGDRSITWDPERFAVRRERVAPFLKRFRVLDGGTTAISLLYWYYDDYDRWPGPEATDIFFFIAQMTQNHASVARFAYLWSAIAQGRRIATQEFADERDRHVQAMELKRRR
jgi:hypothetical protein